MKPFLNEDYRFSRSRKDAKDGVPLATLAAWREKNYDRGMKLIGWIPPHPIKTEKEHARFLAILKKIRIFLNEADSDSALRHNARAKEQIEGYAQYARVIEEFIVHYERDRFPAPKSTPRDMLTFLIEQHRLTQADIAKDLGGQPNVSAILSGKRQLNPHQIRRLSTRFHVSPRAFVTA